MSTPALDDAPSIAAGLRDCAAACIQEQTTLAARLVIAADMISRLYALLLMTEDGERQALNPWRPIDTAPADTEVLVYWPDLWKQPRVALYSSAYQRWHCERSYWVTAPTHWQAMPEVPA